MRPSESSAFIRWAVRRRPTKLTSGTRPRRPTLGRYQRRTIPPRETKDRVAFRRVDLGQASHPDRPVRVWAVAEGREGELWFGTSVGLVRRLVDQQIIHYPFEPSLGTNHLQELLADREGRIWWSHEAGLVMFTPEPASQLRVNDFGAREQQLRRSSMTRGPRRTVHDPRARPPPPRGCPPLY